MRRRAVPVKAADAWVQRLRAPGLSLLTPRPGRFYTGVMKTRTLLLAGLVAATGGYARAQDADSTRVALLARLGLESSGDALVYRGAALTPEQSLLLERFETSLELEGPPDETLARIDRQELAAEGLAPDAPAADGAVWFQKTQDGWSLTDAGARAVPGILLKNAVPAREYGSGSGLLVATDRVQAALAAIENPNFDGAAPTAVAVVPTTGLSRSASLEVAATKPAVPDAPRPRPKPSAPPAVRDAFWSTWWGYHAAFLADFTTTDMVLRRGGFETDHLYTQFGRKNAVGVIGSATAVHLVASAASLLLDRKGASERGFMRWALYAAAVGINGYGIGVHGWGAAHNVGVLDNWNSR